MGKCSCRHGCSHRPGEKVYCISCGCGVGPGCCLTEEYDKHPDGWRRGLCHVCYSTAGSSIMAPDPMDVSPDSDDEFFVVTDDTMVDMHAVIDDMKSLSVIFGPNAKKWVTCQKSGSHGSRNPSFCRTHFFVGFGLSGQSSSRYPCNASGLQVCDQRETYAALCGHHSNCIQRCRRSNTMAWLLRIRSGAP